MLPIPKGAGNVGGYPRNERARRLENFDVTKNPPPGACDPNARVKAMQDDGLACEYIIPTFGLRLDTLRDAELSAPASSPRTAGSRSSARRSRSASSARWRSRSTTPRWA